MAIGTCGHEVEFRKTGPDDDDFEVGYQIAIKEWTRDCKPCISYLTVCETCMKWYKSKHLILSQDQIDHFWD